MVLPDKIEPWVQPSASAARVDPALRYGQTVRAVAAEGAQGWMRVEKSGGEAVYLPEAYLVRYTPEPKGDLAVGSEKVDRDTPLSLKYKPSDLVEVAKRWHYHADARHRLRREAARALERMLGDAKKAGVHLRIASSYRSPMQQRFVYLRKLKKAGLGQKTIAKPGHSEHQLGTAVDITGLDPKTAMKESFGDTDEGRWLEANAPRYGFRLSYPRGSEARTGYRYEPWHIRYMGTPNGK